MWYPRSTRIPLLTLLTTALLATAAAAAPNGEGGALATPPDAREAHDDYILGAEDVIEVFVWKEPDLSTSATVRPDGRIALPLVGEIEGAGKRPRQLQEEITAKLKKYIDQPVVTVMVKEIQNPKISVLGEVRRPGRYLVPQRITVLDAIAMSGGFTEFADRKDVKIFREDSGSTETIEVDVKDMLDGGEAVYLEPRDTVYVD